MLRRVRLKMTDRPLLYRPPELARQALALSYGTIATLINKNRYDEIEPVAGEFLDFCLENSERYTCWQDAWAEYAPLRGYPPAKVRKIV